MSDADLRATSTSKESLPTSHGHAKGKHRQFGTRAPGRAVVIYRDPTEPVRKINLRRRLPTDSRHGYLADNQWVLSARGNSARSSAHRCEQPDRTTVVQRSPILTTDPFPQTSPSSDRSWANPTFNGLTMSGTSFANGYGETVTTTLGQTNNNPYDCKALAAIVFSTPVLDADGDGLPDALEASSNAGTLPWINAKGQPLPDLHAMGASPTHKDIFVEIGAMRSIDGWNPATTGQTPTPGPHTHLPSPAVLKMVGDSFKNSPVANLDNITGIKIHFDVGSGYPTPSEADDYVIHGMRAGARLSRRRHVIPTVRLSVPAFPGHRAEVCYEILRDALVGDDGQQLTTPAQLAAWEAGLMTQSAVRSGRSPSITCDAHARGACLSRGSTSPDFHVPGAPQAF